MTTQTAVPVTVLRSVSHRAALYMHVLTNKVVLTLLVFSAPLETSHMAGYYQRQVPTN